MLKKRDAGPRVRDSGMIYGTLLSATRHYFHLEVRPGLGDAEHFHLYGRVAFPRKTCTLIKNALKGFDAIRGPYEVLSLLGKLCTETAS